ncbi:MAG: hypothetical protein CVU84_05615 [Firmicutes bacterium HGW-Firmicutes-1]|nr:MAG: hypothetical protein CVU84_05615 [Firmicutes bacterium HGW-Firmicutes-1]
MSVLSYLGTFLLLFIPLVNIVLLFIWAFSSKINRNKKNFAIAYLIITVIMIVIMIVFGATAFVFISELIEDMM